MKNRTVDNENGTCTPLSLALGDIISNRRRSRGLTLEEMAARTKLVPLLLELIEAGVCMPHSDDLTRIARCLGHSSCAPFLRAAWTLEEITAERAQESV